MCMCVFMCGHREGLYKTLGVRTDYPGPCDWSSSSRRSRQMLNRPTAIDRLDEQY